MTIEAMPTEVEELEKKVEEEILWAKKHHSFKELNQAYIYAMDLWDLEPDKAKHYVAVLNHISRRWLPLPQRTLHY